MPPPPASRPGPDDYAAAPGAYVSLVPEGDILASMEGGLASTLATYRGLADAAALAVHAPYTWSLKQVLGHVIDCERVFGFRALAIARRDPSGLPGFDENAYMRSVDFDAIPLAGLVDEYEHLRRSHLAFFRHLPSEAWTRAGVANDERITVLALAYVIVGHERHHMRIVSSRLARA
ncbi:DinB superfamily protein [Aquisphaera giovannonii]|uniref:DinB superfamily protein n=1 Tax=Aquisphaera giovannonii TaxID=406548 RepID=A0A5B9WD43_9BACT|nr:DinB family protein [Aquisphaera giovannonii]QEH37985.1 DinB superfamily protein [Aquisphaera giovannonii]